MVGRVRFDVGKALLVGGFALCCLGIRWALAVTVTGQAKPPAMPENFVLRPSFATTQGDIEAGTAFVTNVRGSDRQVILSALHLLGPLGGLKTQIPANQAAMEVKSVALSEAFSDQQLHTVRGLIIPLVEATLAKPSTRAGDILALWAPKRSNLSALPLAAASPRNGAPVWLAARLVTERGSYRKLFRAVVVGHEDRSLLYRFDDPSLETRGTSGAPVLNANGEVVGIHVAGMLENGRKIGIANPVEVFRPYLEAACKKYPPAQ